MGRLAFIYGGVAGSIIIASIIVGFLLGADHGGGAQWLGYSIMIVALTMIFVGVKRFRDRERGGVIKFQTALLLGLMIATVAGVFYVVGWEVYLAATGYTFMETYVDHTIAAKEAAGMAGADLNALATRLEQMEQAYKNPAFRVGITFLEIMPIGLAVALISAVLLRNPRFLPARG